MEPVSVVKKAALARYVWLLQKVQTNKQPLSGCELKELEKYEDEMKKKNDTARRRDTETAEFKKTTDKNVDSPTRGFPLHSNRLRGNDTGANSVRYTLSAASLKLLAFEGKSIAECETLLEHPTSNIERRTSDKKRENSKFKTKNLKLKNLNEIFTERPELKAAFERGRFLRNLAEFGGRNFDVREAEKELDMTAGQLDALFKTYFEAVDVWNQARHKTLVEIKKRWLEMAGMASPAALKQLEKLMSRGIVQTAADLTHITSKQMQELTRKTRQTVEHEWPKTHGLIRNSDSTYNLYIFFPWFEEFIARTRTAPAKQTEPLAAAEKARKYKMENDERAGKLLPREKVIAGQVARFQTILRIFYKTLIEQKDPYIKQSLERTFEEIRREIAATPPELKLSEEQTEELKKLLDSLNSEELTSNELEKSEIINPKLSAGRSAETNSNDENSNKQN